MGLAISFLYTSFSVFYCFSENTQRDHSFLTLSATRVFCWLLLIVGIEVTADPSWYKWLVQLSFVFNIVAESCNLIRQQERADTAMFYSFSLTSGSRTAALWFLIMVDKANGIELSVPAFVLSISILAWFYLYPTFKERHKTLKLYTLTFFLQTWATLDLAIYHSDGPHTMLLIATIGYLVTFAKYYLRAFVKKQRPVNVHWAYFIANAVMALSTVFIALEHTHL
ncbi:hypothetical protein ACPV5L_09660 [Vibrio astriarenae]